MRQSLLTPYCELDLSNEEELFKFLIIIIIVVVDSFILINNSDNNNEYIRNIIDELFDGTADLPRDNAVLLCEESLHYDSIHFHLW